MSDTKVDFAKVTQLLDADWHVCLYRNQLGSYTAEAYHHGREEITDDFTPEQALTRLAYKTIDGIIL
jgi:hypothetical protein